MDFKIPFVLLLCVFVISATAGYHHHGYRHKYGYRYRTKHRFPIKLSKGLCRLIRSVVVLRKVFKSLKSKHFYCPKVIKPTTSTPCAPTTKPITTTTPMTSKVTTTAPKPTTTLKLTTAVVTTTPYVPYTTTRTITTTEPIPPSEPTTTRTTTERTPPPEPTTTKITKGPTTPPPKDSDQLDELEQILADVIHPVKNNDAGKWKSSLDTVIDDDTTDDEAYQDVVKKFIKILRDDSEETRHQSDSVATKDVKNESKKSDVTKNQKLNDQADPANDVINNYDDPYVTELREVQGMLRSLEKDE